MNFHSGKINQAMTHKLLPTVPTIFNTPPPPLRYNGQPHEIGPISAPHVKQTKAFEVVYFRQGLLTTLSALSELQNLVNIPELQSRTTTLSGISQNTQTAKKPSKIC